MGSTLGSDQDPQGGHRTLRVGTGQPRGVTSTLGVGTGPSGWAQDPQGGDQDLCRRVPLTRRRSPRKQLRDRGQLWHLWRARGGSDTSTEDCAAFSETNEPLINYVDVSREAQSGLGLSQPSPNSSPKPRGSGQCPACRDSLPARRFVPGNAGMRTREGIDTGTASPAALCPRSC